MRKSCLISFIRYSSQLKEKGEREREIKIDREIDK